jgi:hypothetical protein
VVAIVCALLCCLSGYGGHVAHADDKPWANGVSDSEQKAALSIYNEGNTEFEESHYTQALAKYREAIQHWDHPAIRFNMAVCLINLDNPLEAYDDIEKALKYGDAPLGKEVYAQGLSYEKLLKGQIATLEVKNKEPGADVSLDGNKLFSGANDVTKLLLPGEHQVVATKPGYITATIPLVLIPGKTTVADVKMIELKAAPTKMVRRWKTWKPWALVIGGAAMAGIIGGALELQSSNDFSTYDREVGQACLMGCTGTGSMMGQLPQSTADIKSTAHFENIMAISAFAVGGAALAAGIVALVLNQPHAVVITEKPKTISVIPVVGPNTASVVVDWRF